MEMLFFLVIIIILASGVNYIEDRKLANKECNYHQWLIKGANSSRLECRSCGKIVTNED